MRSHCVVWFRDFLDHHKYNEPLGFILGWTLQLTKCLVSSGINELNLKQTLCCNNYKLIVRLVELFENLNTVDRFSLSNIFACIFLILGFVYQKHMNCKQVCGEGSWHRLYRYVPVQMKHPRVHVRKRFSAHSLITFGVMFYRSGTQIIVNAIWTRDKYVFVQNVMKGAVKLLSLAMECTCFCPFQRSRLVGTPHQNLLILVVKWERFI